jgi:hypothetical protein
VSVDALPMLEAEARERQATSTGGASPQLKEKIPEAEKGQARDHAATLFQTNPRYVQDAKKLQAEAPDLHAEVRAGNPDMAESSPACNPNCKIAGLSGGPAR